MTHFTSCCETVLQTKKKREMKRILSIHLSQSQLIHVVLIAAILCFGVVYLSQVNAMASKGYKINELEASAYELSDINQKLNVEIANWRSMGNLTERLERVEMVPAGHVEYVSLSSATSVAVNK